MSSSVDSLASASVAISSQTVATAHAASSSVGDREPVSTASVSKSSSTSTIHPIRSIPLQPSRQFNTPEVNNADSRTRHGTQETVHQRTSINMSSISTPTRRQRRAGIPPHTKRQTQRIPNRNLGIARMTRHGIRSRRIHRPGRHTLRTSMNQQIQIIPHMQMAQLQCPRQRNNERRVHCTLRPQRTLLCAFIADPVFGF